MTENDSILYKFTGKFRPACSKTECGEERYTALSILDELRIRISPPKFFNDPFEITPRTVVPETIEQLAADIRQHPEVFGSRFPAHAKKRGLTCSFEEFLNDGHLERDLKTSPDLFKILKEKAVAGDLKSLEAASSYFGVLCLAKNLVNICMWSYYADSHRGIAVGFDFARCPPSDIRGGSDWVTYSKDRFLFDSRYSIDSKEFQDALRKTFFHKSDVWTHEAEFRHVMLLEDLDFDKAMAAHYLTFDPQCVRRVVFGVLTPESVISNVFKILEKPSMRHIECFKCTRHPHLYELGLESVPH